MVACSRATCDSSAIVTLSRKRRCTRVELTRPNRAGGKLQYYRTVVYFDQESKLPIGVQNYDWPEKPGGDGELVESFRYTDLRLNVSLPDSVFEH